MMMEGLPVFFEEIPFRMSEFEVKLALLIYSIQGVNCNTLGLEYTHSQHMHAHIHPNKHQFMLVSHP
jgi:hypothetical protein